MKNTTYVLQNFLMGVLSVWGITSLQASHTLSPIDTFRSVFHNSSSRLHSHPLVESPSLPIMTAADLLQRFNPDSPSYQRDLERTPLINLQAQNFNQHSDVWRHLAGSNLCHLETLNMRNTQGADQFLIWLAQNQNLSRLRTIEVSGADITLEGLRALRDTATRYFVRDREQLDAFERFPVVRMDVIIGGQSSLFNKELYSALCDLTEPGQPVFAQYRFDSEPGLHEAKFKLEIAEE